MPTSFTTVTDGQLSDADQLNQYGPPINALEVLLGNLSAPELSYLLGVTSAIQAQLDAKAALSHTHLISQLSDWPAGLTITELGYLDGVTSAIQAQLDAKASSSALTSGLAGKSDTGHNHSLTSLTGWPGGLTLTELGYLDGVTSAIQAQLDAKAALSHTHTISQLSDWPGGLTVLELGYLGDVTGLVQAQLDGKAALSHTHNASEITTGTIATARLGSGTADSTTFLCGDQTYKTISAIDASKLPLTGGVITGAIVAGAGNYTPTRGWGTNANGVGMFAASGEFAQIVCAGAIPFYSSSSGNFAAATDFSSRIAFTGTQTSAGNGIANIYRDASGNLWANSTSGTQVCISTGGTLGLGLGNGGLTFYGTGASLGPAITNMYRNSGGSLIANIPTSQLFTVSVNNTDTLWMGGLGYLLAAASTTPANSFYGMWRNATLSQTVLQGPTAGCATLLGADGGQVKAHGATEANRAGCITLRSPGVNYTNNSTWTNFYNLAEGTHNGEFHIFTNKGEGKCIYPIAGTTLTAATTTAGGIAFVNSGSAGVSNVSCRVSGGWLQIWVGTSVASDVYLHAEFHGNVR
jgi:hypothetical protein